MAIELHPHAVYVGQHNLAAHRDLNVLEPPQWCDDLFFSGNSYKAFEHQSESLLVRLEELISRYSMEISRIPPDAAIFLLLPELEKQDDVLHLVKRINTLLADKANCQRPILCYPYGNASFLVAFERIMNSLEHHECWILSIDTSALFCLGSEYQLFEDIKTDSLLLVSMRRSDHGLLPSNVEFDRHSTHYKSGVARVMASLSLLCQGELTDLYLPLNESDTAQWQSQLHRFSPWVTENTQYVFSNIIVGQLGAGTGLFKALYAYQKQLREQKKRFYAMQLDGEECGLAAGILFRWNGRSEGK